MLHDNVIVPDLLGTECLLHIVEVRTDGLHCLLRLIDCVLEVVAGEVDLGDEEFLRVTGPVNVLGVNFAFLDQR